MSTTSSKVLVLFGPTAVGKTATIERLDHDGRLPRKPVVVISADSVQVYRGLDLGSAKPSMAERLRMRHELIDIRDPSEPFSVGDFVRLADEACDRVTAEGALPVLSGGTAYYIKAFLYGQPPAPPSDAAVRAALQAELAERGPAALRAELARVDPETAARLAPADLYRITRALEVYRCSGLPLSSFVPPAEPRPRWKTLVVGLDRPRTELYARIDARVDAMLAAGLAEEVQALRAAGYGPGDPGLRAIGYSEFLAATPGQNGELPLESIAADIQMHTRRYAKRQLTFMRSIPGVRWFGADDYEAIFSEVEGWLLTSP